MWSHFCKCSCGCDCQLFSNEESESGICDSCIFGAHDDEDVLEDEIWNDMYDDGGLK